MNIESVILQRIKLQSTQRLLQQKFGITSYNIKSLKVLAQNSKWTDKEKKLFLNIVGGRNYLKFTESYFNENYI
jgi:hypothetical protein